MKYILIIAVFASLLFSGCTLQKKTLADCEKEKGANSCYQYVAADSKNMSICQMITEPQPHTDWCYRWYGYKNKDISACDEIENQSLVSECRAMVSSAINGTLAEYYGLSPYK